MNPKPSVDTIEHFNMTTRFKKVLEAKNAKHRRIKKKSQKKQ